MKLTALQYGITELREHRIFPEGDRERRVPISLMFFLIETGERRILVDTGCDTMPGFVLHAHVPPVQLLGTLGLKPADITDVVLTHGHGDHAQCACHFPDARFWMHRDTLPQAREFLPPEAKVSLFAETASPVPGVTVRWIGGHAAGSCVVELGNTVLCGDECYSPENLRRGIPTGGSCCPEKSLAFIHRYAKAPWRPVVFHDPQLLGGIGTGVIELL